jgi:hypothetical protein
MTKFVELTDAEFKNPIWLNADDISVIRRHPQSREDRTVILMRSGKQIEVIAKASEVLKMLDSSAKS